VSIELSEFIFAEYDRRQSAIADVDFYFDLAGTSYPAADSHDVTPGLELQVGNFEPLGGESDRSKSFSRNRLEPLPKLGPGSGSGDVTEFGKASIGSHGFSFAKTHLRHWPDGGRRSGASSLHAGYMAHADEVRKRPTAIKDSRDTENPSGLGRRSDEASGVGSARPVNAPIGFVPPMPPGMLPEIARDRSNPRRGG
jgi:hypothetical protein